jgi:hypothetical protein
MGKIQGPPPTNRIENIPITIDWYSLANWDARKSAPDADLTWNRFSFMHQVLIARKFSNKFSAQLMPTLVHYNVIPYGLHNHNNIYSIGMGARYALNEKKALTFEYSRQLNMYEKVIDKSGTIIDYEPDLLALGMEFSTGGHNFSFISEVLPVLPISNSCQETQTESFMEN